MLIAHTTPFSVDISNIPVDMVEYLLPVIQEQIITKVMLLEMRGQIADQALMARFCWMYTLLHQNGYISFPWAYGKLGD